MQDRPAASNRILLFATALAALAAVLLGAPASHAQGRQPVDLELTMTDRSDPDQESETSFVVHLTNHSDVAVRDITVRFEVEDLTRGGPLVLREYLAHNTDRNDGALDLDTLTWTIPHLRSGNTATTKLDFSVFTATTSIDAVVRLRGDIVASTPPEAPDRLGNNRARQDILWHVDIDLVEYETHSLSGLNLSYGVDADPDTNIFTISVINPSHDDAKYSWWKHSLAQYQLRFRVTPSAGLRYTEMASAAGTTFDTATGIWDVGTLVDLDTSTAPTWLRIRVAGGGPPAAQCLTVEVEHVVPDPEVAWLPVTACMEHKALITEGGFGIFTWYDCVNGIGYPCGDDYTLELVAVKPVGDLFGTAPASAYAVADIHRGRFRSDHHTYFINDFLQYVVTNDMILQPEELVLYVPDNALTRKNASGTPFWTTTDPFFGMHTDQRQFDTDWTAFTEAVTVSGVDGGPAPGRWRVGRPGFELLDAPNQTKVTRTAYTYNQIPAGDRTFIRFAFGALGTYQALYEVAVTYFGTTYTDSATYTFHVGPVAELEVRDAPAHSLAEPGRQAYTLMAINHGPDTAPAVDVPLTGVPQGAEVVPSQGTFAWGACRNGLCEGVWSVGALGEATARAAIGETEGEVLTIIPPRTTASPITATIANTQDYTACIDSDGNDIVTNSQAACTSNTGASWHTTNYYDYLDHNNTAQIALRTSDGTAGRPDRPTVARFSGFSLIRWAPLDSLNGFPVSHYEVQRSTNGPWEPVGGVVEGTVTVDPARRGSTAYRVRAVNTAGGHGPWSLPSGSVSTAAVLAPPEKPDTFRAILITDSDVQLTWAAADPAQEITAYTIQAADHAGGPWSTVARVNGDATRWVHTGLPASGATKYYRVRAHNRFNHSEWATTSVDLKTGEPPTGLRAQRYTTNQGNHAIQVWLGSYACPPDAADCWAIIEYRESGGAWQFGSQAQNDYGIVPWGPDEPYFTTGDGQRHAIRLDTAYDIRVCQLTNDELEAKFATDAFVPEGEWCRGEPSGRLRVPAGE